MAKGLRSKKEKRNRSILRKTVMMPIINKRRKDLSELSKRVLSNSVKQETLNNIRKTLFASARTKIEDESDDEEMEIVESKVDEPVVGVNSLTNILNDKIPTKFNRKFVVEPKNKYAKHYSSTKELVWFN